MEESEHDEWLEDCKIDHRRNYRAFLHPGSYLRTRQRKSNRQDQYQKLDDEQQFMHGQGTGTEIQNQSDRLPGYRTFSGSSDNQGHGSDGAKGKNVLNLFCYTGSFSVYAAAGGAAEVVSVDLSKTYLKWATENMELNGFYDPQNISICMKM